MSWSMYMNIEVLALDIIEEHLEFMSDDNYDRQYEEKICDEVLFENNLKHGWIVVIMLMSYLESVVNTILRDCIKYKGDRIMKSNLEEKIEIISLKYGIDILEFKKKSSWNAYKIILNIRNELIHYKNNYLCHSGGGIWQVKIGKHNLLDIFTKPEMRKIKDRFIDFSELFIDELDLVINKKAELFTADGRSGYISYVVDKGIIKEEWYLD